MSLNMNQLRALIREFLTEEFQISEGPEDWGRWKAEVDAEFKKKNPRAIPGTAEYAKMNMAAKQYTNTTPLPPVADFLRDLGLGNGSTSSRPVDPHMPTYPGTFDGQVFTAKLGFDTRQIFFPKKHVDEETGEESTRRGTRFVDQQNTRTYVWDAQAQKWLRGNKLPRSPMPTSPHSGPSAATPKTNVPPPAPLRGPRPSTPRHEPKVVRRRPTDI